jgi:hypothetical protein
MHRACHFLFANLLVYLILPAFLLRRHRRSSKLMLPIGTPNV